MIKKFLNIFLKRMLITIVILLLVGYFFIGNYFYNMALNPNTSKSFVLGEYMESEEMSSMLEENSKWLADNSEDMYITSRDGKFELHAYEITNTTSSDNWAIVIHGYMGQGSEMVNQGRHFYENGYNVLILDLRGHGKSEGDYVGMGWDDRLDVIKWANYIIDRNENSKIILYGVSMGAATVMMTTGEELPQNIKVAIEDCGYSSVWEEFGMQLKELFGLPTFPALDAANTICKIRAGYSIKDASSVEQVKKSKTPTLFIHGDADTFVPFSMLDEVYEAASCKKEKLVIKNAAHAQSANMDPDTYWGTVDRFIGENL